MSTLTRRLTVIYSLTLTQARCLSILTLSGFCLSILTLTQACCLSILSLRLAACLFSHQQTHRLILTLSDSLPSILTRRLAVYLFSHSHSGSLPVYSHTIRLLPICSHTIWLAACLFSHKQTHCLPILTLSDSLPSILTPSGSLPIYSHTIRLTLCLFSHSSYCLSVFTPNAVKAFLLSSSPMNSCTLGLTAYVFSYSN